MAYLGGERSINFFIGPMSLGQGEKRKGHFDFAHIKAKFYSSSKSTQMKSLAGSMTKSGIFNQLLKTFIMLAFGVMCINH